MSFRVGQVVVCVDDTDENYGNWSPVGTMDGLAKGKTYTVRKCGDYRGFPCVWLIEIERPILRADHGEAGFHVVRFRAAEERVTDISVFTKILDMARKTERV